MAEDKQMAALQHFETVSQIRLEALLNELTRRVRVVNEDALKHPGTAAASRTAAPAAQTRG
jgi:hypothetical protein